jgi:septal ring factor EnvC (AmiA/AmiB activator)
MKAGLRLLAALALAPTLAGAATRAEVDQRLTNTRQNLKQLDKDLKEGRRRVQEQAKAEKNIVGVLNSLNRKVDAAKRDAQVHVRNLTLVEDRLGALRERQGQVQQLEQSDRRALAAQLRAVQKARQRQGAALLFGARTPAQLAARAGALRQLSIGTQRHTHSLRQRQEQLQAYAGEYSLREKELLLRRGEAEVSRRAALAEASRRQAQLQKVRRSKAQIQQVLAGKERDARSLQDLMDNLMAEAGRQAQARARAAKSAPRHAGRRVLESGPSLLRGRVPWPVNGRLLSRFGKQRHPQYATWVFNKNIEIAAPFGAPIHAVADGRVVHVGEMGTYGMLVVLDHEGGMSSVYGYASQPLVKVGQAVTQGETIAEVGEHSLSGQPSLYFQISQNARPQDPLRYLGRR